MDNMHKKASEILQNAFAPPTEEPEKAEEPQPIEEPEAEPSSSETLQPAEEQDEDISTLNNLAEALDISIEDMYALDFKIPDGQETVQVDLGTLKNFYLENQDIDKVRQEIEIAQQTGRAERSRPAPCSRRACSGISQQDSD